MNLRHEWKHEISRTDLLILRHRLGAVAHPDSHGSGGRYSVRSLYFDTPEDTALREKLDGVDRREKFRLRCYDGDTSFIRLEKKSKLRGLCAKEQTVLTPDECRALLAGDRAWMENDPRPTVRELYGKMLRTGLRPRTVVDYTREAFIYPAGGTRVTLDYDIRTGLGSTDFLNPACITVPAGDAPVILEVKWDRFLPSVIRDAVQLGSRRSAAFSKYAACRIYG